MSPFRKRAVVIDYGDPEIEVTAVEPIAGLTAKDQEAIAAHQWEVDAMRRREPDGRWNWVRWPLGKVDPYGQTARPCSCASDLENNGAQHLGHALRIEHINGLATEEQDALADFLRERDAAEPVNWKILRRWRYRQGRGNYSSYLLIDKDRDPPIWWDRAAFVERRRVGFDYDEAQALATSDEHYAKSAADRHKYASECYADWLAKKAQLPIEQAILDAVPGDRDQADRVAMLRYDVEGTHCPHAPPRLHTAAEKRAESLASIAGMRSRVGEEVARAEDDLAELVPKLRALLATLRPENW